MIIQEWIFQSSLEEEKHASSVKALKIWKAQCPDAPWNYKKKQAAARRSTSAVKRSKGKFALFDDTLEVEEDVAFEDKYDKNSSVPRGSS